MLDEAILIDIPGWSTYADDDEFNPYLALFMKKLIPDEVEEAFNAVSENLYEKIISGQSLAIPYSGLDRKILSAAEQLCAIEDLKITGVLNEVT